MADFKPDQESVSRAKSLSSQLMTDLRNMVESGSRSEMRRELFSAQRYEQEAAHVPISDVVTNIGQMATEFAMARRWDGEILCMKFSDGELAPISMATYPGGYGPEGMIEFWERYGPFPMHRYWREFLWHERSEEDHVILTNVEEAEEGIQRSLSNFLSYRFSGMKKWAEWIQGKGISNSVKSTDTSDVSGSGSAQPPRPPAVGAGGGLQVQVSCSTPGLRIHVSPAYFINWIFFGSPTTPVTGYVSPGRYIFAGDGPMLPRRTKDNGVFCIPPTYYPSLSKF